MKNIDSFSRNTKFQHSKMSLFSFQINFEKFKMPKNVFENVSRIIADSLSQDPDYVNGTLVDQVNLSWRGSSEPMVFLTIQTVRILDAKLNQSCIEALYKFLTSVLDIPEDRIIVYFTEKVLSDVAIDGSLLLSSS
ncbi:D-dopachrome decarboxylase-like [Planococcus citri]|uniref:D-dopachrome decarboxylase-like n=1 Tax=Planococcus citri TaxID=170843 RepID=UPI0031F776A6